MISINIQISINLQSVIEESKKICDKDDATTEELIKALVNLSCALKEFEASRNK